MPNNRQWAALVWLLILSAFVLVRRDTRQMLTGLLHQLWAPKIFVPLLLFTGYCVGVIAAGAAVGAWTLQRTTDTVVWFGGALALLFRATKVAEERRFVRHSLVEPMGVAAILVFFVGLFPLALWAELLLLPMVMFAVALSIVASGHREHAAAKLLVDILLTTCGLALLAWAIYQATQEWDIVSSADTVRALLLPMWATAAVVPVVYLFGVLMEYEKVALRVRNADPAPGHTWRVLAGIASVLKLHVRDIATLDTTWARRMAKAGSFATARTVTAQYRLSLREKEGAQHRSEEWFRKCAGVKGTDEEGRQLDQREFDVTRRALQWLATVQMGFYHNDFRYNNRALDIANFSDEGLSADHGIQIVVRKDGQAWYAWRRTPSCWCLGIGAAAPPPDQWLGDGPQPPDGFPGRDTWWGSEPFGVDTSNW